MEKYEIQWALKESDVEWVMDWPANSSPEKDPENVFEQEKALALLLINDVILVTTFWYKEDWPEGAKYTINFIVNCNDVFSWGSADGEELPFKEIENLYRMWRKDPAWGAAIWCMIQRREMPQKPVENLIRKAGIWDVDSLKLDVNTTDAEVQAWMRVAAYQLRQEQQYNWSA